ncbi:MAG TPA: hypothetical protein VEU55_04570 [Gemmatimonadales bacterium]|nr:hypothetical protein [Gemmatimonadales bacterium]
MAPRRRCVLAEGRTLSRRPLPRAPGRQVGAGRARRALGTALCFVIAACQPEARRALVLDLTLADPVVVSSTAEPWHDAGYSVEYRQFYPHLVRADLARYRTLIFLLGREPEAPSDAVTAGDLALLHEWLLRGGVVVLGYDADGEGSLDRWTANRWLEFEGAGIGIGDRLLEDTTARRPTTTGHAQPWAEARAVGDEPLGSVYEPFPLDRNHPVDARAAAQLLAASGPQAFVRAPHGLVPRGGAGVAAATRVAAGLVIVLSRHALGALGPQFRATTAPVLELDALARTRDFLTALARWTRRPAEWAHVPPATHAVPLALGGAPAAVELTPPPLSAPRSATTTPLPLAARPEFAHATSSPDWLRQQGMRVLWAPLLLTREGRHLARSSRALDSLVEFLDAGGFNLLAGDAAPEATDSARARSDERETVRHAWADAVTRLQPTSVAWIPAFDAAAVRSAAGDPSRGPRGEAVAAPCAFDSTLWAGALAPAYAALARLAGDQRALVIALGLDLAGWRAPGLEFCDAAWRRGLTRIVRAGPWDSLPYAARYPTLRDAGLLALYYRALEDEVTERAGALQERVLRQRRDVYFAFRLPALPADWFTLGLLRGFALADRPMLVFTPEIRTREALAAYRARDLNLVHAVVLVPAALRARDASGLKRLIFDENDGFWLPTPEARGGASPDARRLPTDSLTRLIRRLAR